MTKRNQLDRKVPSDSSIDEEDPEKTAADDEFDNFDNVDNVDNVDDDDDDDDDDIVAVDDEEGFGEELESTKEADKEEVEGGIREEEGMEEEEEEEGKVEGEKYF